MSVQVRLKSYKGNIVFSLPKKYSELYYGMRQKQIAYGAKATEENKLEALGKKKQLELDLEHGNFNPSNVKKYKKVDNLHMVKPHKDYTLIELFDKFTDYNPNLSDVGRLTYKRSHRPLLLNLEQFDYTTAKGQYEIYEYLKNNWSPSHVYKVLGVLCNTIEWAIRSDLLDSKTRLNLKEHKQALGKSKFPKRKQSALLQGTTSRADKKAWTKEERDIIIEAYHTRKGIHAPFYQQCDMYAYLVEFLFLTGMRHGEAMGLLWQDVLDDCTKVNINKSYNSQFRKLRNTTKNDKHRVLSLSPRATEILKIIKDKSQSFGLKTKDNNIVFRSHKDTFLSTKNFNRLWVGQSSSPRRKESIGIVSGLVLTDKLPQHLVAYSTRSTFISLQAQAGVDAKTVANYVGDNVETIFKHYYQGKENFTPIEI